jgi:hypothetical protein
MSIQSGFHTTRGEMVNPPMWLKGSASVRVNEAIFQYSECIGVYLIVNVPN